MNMQKAQDITYLLLRLVMGLMFFQAGGMKLFSWYGGMPGGATAPVMSQVWIGGVLEFVGGILIMLGLLTHPVAFILSGMMAVAYFQFHQPGGTWPVQNGGVAAVVCCFVYLYIAAKGGGPWSLDAVVRPYRMFQKKHT